MIITSHAACRGHVPENTLAGVRKAVELGADAIEIDLHCTRDRVPVLIHDRTLERTTNGTGKIADLSLRQARALDAGDGEHIPTLRQVFDEVRGRALMVLEVKAPDIEEEVLAVVRKSNALGWCVVHSFSPYIVGRVRQLEPKMPCSLLVSGEGRKDWQQVFDRALSLDAQGVALYYEDATDEVVRAAHLRELRCSSWTVNKQADVRRLAAAGVDAITSDYPDRVRRWLGSRR